MTPPTLRKTKKIIQVGGRTPVVEINPHSPHRGGTKRIWHVWNVYSHISIFERVTVSLLNKGIYILKLVILRKQGIIINQGIIKITNYRLKRL